MESSVVDALGYSIRIIRHNRQTLEDFPESCTDAQWSTVEHHRDAGHWVDGFWTGLLWLAYLYSDDPDLASAARDWSARLNWLKDSRATHDLGFIFTLSHVVGGQITGDASFLADALHAASTLIERFNPRGEYLQAWGTPDGRFRERGRTNIDVMMNLALLFWASAYSGDPRYGEIASLHARTTRLALVRHDGSVAQVGDFNPNTGAFLRRDTHQGLHYDSCWSRGLGWGLYGFANAFRWTGAEVFRATARCLAEYVIRRAPDDHVPFWDYDSPDIPDTFRDSSAAAVIACGLLELADGEDNTARATQWRAEANAIVHSLWEHYSTRGTDVPALLLHGSRSVPHGKMDTALIYGDYYFFEALLRLTRPDLLARALPQPKENVVVRH